MSRSSEPVSASGFSRFGAGGMDKLADRMTKRKTRLNSPSDLDAPIKFAADFQTDWQSVVKPLKKDLYRLESTDRLSISGDAPKGFLRIKEYVEGKPSHENRPLTWPAFIAKVGSKWYPVESVTEQLITRVGQVAGVPVADSQLRIVGTQVRFLSRYFLHPKRELLTHGSDIFKRHLEDEALVEEIASKKQEKEFYTFQVVCLALRDVFGEQADVIIGDFVEMAAFDALVGNNDRHPANWGVIESVKVTSAKQPRFSPIFDTARGLFWNTSEKNVLAILADNVRLESYIRKSTPQVGWDGCENLSSFHHFDLMLRVSRDYPQMAPAH